MKDDLEKKLEDFTLPSPPEKLRGKILEAARSSWTKSDKGRILKPWFLRKSWQLAAGIVLLLSVLFIMNSLENQKTVACFQAIPVLSEEEIETRVRHLVDLGASREHGLIMVKLSEIRKNEMRIKALIRRI